MRSSAFREIRISLYVLALILCCCILFYLFASMFTAIGYKGFEKARNANAETEETSVTIIIDPGHGGEDPGATEKDLIEKTLNLDVALKLSDFLAFGGYNTVLTRNEDILLYDSEADGTKKQQDLSNRVRIAKEYQHAYFVSIHMNKFPVEYCKGLQTFYSDNNEKSKLLAESVQQSAQLLQTDNKRVIKNGTDNIYVLENLDIPAILIECGFISNTNEASLLSKDEYKSALAFSIYCGIAAHLEN